MIIYFTAVICKSKYSILVSNFCWCVVYFMVGCMVGEVPFHWDKRFIYKILSYNFTSNTFTYLQTHKTFNLLHEVPIIRSQLECHKELKKKSINCFCQLLVGNFYKKNFRKKNNSLLVQRGKIPLKRGPQSNGCFGGLSFLFQTPEG